MEPEYFYQEVQRWSFGFENPNKAAVIFACLLPLCWWAWTAAWRIRSVRIPGLMVAAGAFLAVGICLVMTYSRGGLVAGLVALGYLWALSVWRGFGSNAHCKVAASGSEGVTEGSPDGATPSKNEVRKSPRCWLSMLLVISLVFLAVWSGLVDRSASALGEDASVTNRFDLWKAGLQMAYENPAGFGSGQSGREFMQWYQATDRTEGYRTMVNSYLTFLVEQGWGVFALAVFGLMVFWFSTVPDRGQKTEGIAIALRASVLAFLVAGLFSTTMEDWRLWIIPACCALGLIGLWGGLLPRKITFRPLVRGLCGTAVIVSGLWIGGFLQSREDPLARKFAPSPQGISVVAIEKKGGKKTMRFISDVAVLGPMQGKLLRSLALESSSKIVWGDRTRVPVDLVVLAGEAVNGPWPKDDVPVLLLAPAKIDEEHARSLLARRSRIRLLLPEIDEDGRSAFWRALADQCPREGLVCRELEGVGTQVDWAWKQVIESIEE